MAILRKRVLWIAGGAILLVILSIVLVVIFDVKTLRPQIEAAATSALGMEVRIGGPMNVFFSPSLGVSLADISVKNNGAGVAKMSKMKIGLKLFSSLRRTVAITWMELVDPVISIVRLKNGKLNIETPKVPGSGSPIILKKFDISRGKIVFDDVAAVGKVEWEGLDLTLGNLPVGGVGSPDPLKTVTVTKDIRCRKITAGKTLLTNLSMSIAAGNGIFDVSRVRMNIFGGVGSGTLHADFTGSSPDFRATCTVKRLRIENLLQEPEKKESIEGWGDFTADLAARGNTLAEVKRSLTGRISLDGKNILLNDIDLDARLTSLARSQNFNLVDIGGFFLVGPLGPALVRSYSFANFLGAAHGGKTVILQMVSIWKVGGGVVEAVDVAMSTKKHRIAMKGGLNFISGRFEEVTAAIVDPRGCPVYTQKIHGPFDQPQINKVNILGSLVRPMMNVLRSMKKIVGGKCKVFYSGSVAPPGGDQSP
jgi:uncharacterized protein involved in outer membrane biogenesis